MNVALPRVRDFKGVSDRSFDGRGNYSLGIREQIIFPEIDLDKIDKVKGPDDFHRTTARTDGDGKALLRALGMPVPQLGGVTVAKTCLRVKATRPAKFGVRQYNRCPLCGRAAGVLPASSSCAGSACAISRARDRSLV